MKDFLETLQEIIKQVGLKLAWVLPAFAGALVSMAYMKRISLRRRLTLLFTGTVTAASMTPLISYWMGTVPPQVESGMSFLIGLISMQATDALINILAFLGANPASLFEILKTLNPFKKTK